MENNIKAYSEALKKAKKEVDYDNVIKSLNIDLNEFGAPAAKYETKVATGFFYINEYTPKELIYEIMKEDLKWRMTLDLELNREV